jgi:hypothetical protein
MKGDMNQMMKYFRWTGLTILIAVLLPACAAGTTPVVTSTAPPDAALSALEELSLEFQIPVDEIEIVSYSQEEWTDSCLGLGTAEEICAQVITPGWRVVLEVDGTEYVYRTDISADIIRLEQ